MYPGARRNTVFKYRSPMADDIRNSDGRIPMDSREWFILGIRLFGIWLLTRGVGYFASFVDFRFGLTETSGELSPNSRALKLSQTSYRREVFCFRWSRRRLVDT